MMRLWIRRMTLQDIPLFNSVRNECRAFLSDTNEYTLEQSADWFRRTKPEFWILTTDGLPIGYFRTSERTETSIMVGLDIHKDFRGRGLARQAYDFFFATLRSAFPTLEMFKLRVNEDNARARHLYEALGFVYTGVTVGTELEMERPC